MARFIKCKKLVFDFNFEMVDYSRCRNCKIHTGFLADFKSVEKQIIQYMDTLLKKYSTATIVNTGHSLGAAMSTLCALQLKIKYNLKAQRVIIHNYGSPRLGQINLAHYIHNQIGGKFRIVHNKDIVPHLPPQVLGYHHIPYEIFFDFENVNFKICNESGEDQSCSNKFAPNYSFDEHQQYFIPLDNVQC